MCPSLGSEGGAVVRIRFVVSLMIGALAFSFLQLAAGAAALDTFRALPAAQQRPAPAFTLPDQNGTPLRLADLRGKVVVVRFWVTW
jgi:cytochrome oxidase Cu insertion factor (SCO1/SenC/PrrC family)